MSRLKLVRLHSADDAASRVDDVRQTAGLRGGIISEQPLGNVGDARLDCSRLDPDDTHRAASVERSGVLRALRVGKGTWMTIGFSFEQLLVPEQAAPRPTSASLACLREKKTFSVWNVWLVLSLTASSSKTTGPCASEVAV